MALLKSVIFRWGKSVAFKSKSGYGIFHSAFYSPSTCDLSYQVRHRELLCISISMQYLQGTQYVPITQDQWWKENAVYSTFNRQGVDITCVHFLCEHAKANVFLVIGWNQTFLLYSDFIRVLIWNGFNVYTYDHQGQGLSERWITDSSSLWVYSFDDYCDDLAFYITTTCRNDPSLPAYAIAHSLGGLILGITMSRHPTLVNRAVMTAPMFRNRYYFTLNDHWVFIPEPIIYWSTSILCLLGLGSFRALGLLQEPPSDKLFLNGFFEQSPIQIRTSDEGQLQNQRVLRQRYPSITLNTVTNDWVRLCISAQRNFFRRFRFVRTNTLILSAASDSFSHNRAMVEFAQHAVSCKVLIAPCSHEILFESPDVRNAATNIVIDFLRQETDDVHLVRAKDPFSLVDPSFTNLSVTEKIVRGAGLVVGSIGAITGVLLMVGASIRR